MDGLPAKISPQGYVVIHGHFYQPPRENPWIEQIEVEPSATPYHDWNTRITAECYHPNGVARVYDGQGRILDIVNNYQHLSFNFGPTLISWLEAQAPDTYARILEADAQSLAALGHGNAIAQAYNHAILPLANSRDRETQVIWGLKDFEHRFRRPAAAMWLPETTVNYPTLATLVDHGMKFVILSPYQAKRVRPLAGGEWTPASSGLDTTQAYRCYLPEKVENARKRRFIDVFLYNGQVAADISFGDLLSDSYRLAARLVDGFSRPVCGPSCCTWPPTARIMGTIKNSASCPWPMPLPRCCPNRGSNSPITPRFWRWRRRKWRWNLPWDKRAKAAPGAAPTG